MSTKHQQALHALVDLHADFIKAAKPALQRSGGYTSGIDVERVLSPVMDLQHAINLITLGRTENAIGVLEQYQALCERKAIESGEIASRTVGFFGVSKHDVKHYSDHREQQTQTAARFRDIIALIR